MLPALLGNYTVQYSREDRPQAIHQRFIFRRTRASRTQNGLLAINPEAIDVPTCVDKIRRVLEPIGACARTTRGAVRIPRPVTTKGNVKYDAVVREISGEIAIIG